MAKVAARADALIGDALARLGAIAEQLEALRPVEESDLTIEIDEVRAMVGSLESDLALSLDHLREAAA
jgi:hypothetical protein